MGIKTKFYIAVIVVFFFPKVIVAQEADPVLTKYTLGKELFSEGKYGLAKKSFEQVFNQNENQYRPYAIFYHALASWYLEYPYLTRDRLLKLKREYPDWEQMEEVDFWLARAYFKQKNYQQALEIVKSEKYQNSKNFNELKESYLSYLTTPDTLTVLYNTYPQDEVIGKFLLDKLYTVSPIEVNLDLYDDLFSKYGDRENGYSYQPKDTIDVGVFFPFLTNKLTVDDKDKINEFVLKIYRGLALATDTLSTKGKKVNLILYDTYRSADSVKSILEKPEIKNLDLIIGPLFYGEILNTYLPLLKINAVNPLSQKTSLIKNNPYHYLFSTPPEVGAAQVGKFLNNEYDSAARGYLLYGVTEEDSISANAFKEEIVNDSIEFSKIMRVDEESYKSIINLLVGAREINDFVREEEEKRKLEIETEEEEKLDSIDFVFVATSDPKGRLYNNVLSSVNARPDTVSIYAGRNWNLDRSVDLELLENLNVLLPTDGMMYFNAENYNIFFRKYLEKYGEIPDQYSSIGFELMYFFGQVVLEYGKYFNSKLSSETYRPGFLSPGFNYSETNYNSHLLLYRIQNANYVFEEIVEKENEEENEQKEK